MLKLFLVVSGWHSSKTSTYIALTCRIPFCVVPYAKGVGGVGGGDGHGGAAGGREEGIVGMRREGERGAGRQGGNPKRKDGISDRL